MGSIEKSTPFEFTTFRGSKEGKIVERTSKRELAADEVLVKVTHSGLCGTDQHFKCVDMVLGHEGVGFAAEVGSAVTTFKKGDVVGWGYQNSSCGNCKQCQTGFETLCASRSMYGYADLDQGSFGTYAVRKASFLFQVPKEIEAKHAAPLMCGGATVWNSLAEFGIKPRSRIGVVGIGGLGHLAIQFADKMGCEVVVFSGTDSKREEALKLGAKEFYAAKGVKEFKIGQPLDALLVTTSAQPDWTLYLPIMAPNGKIFPLSVDHGNFSIPYMALIASQLSVHGTLVAPRQVHRDMLEFAAHHGIKPMVEEFPMTTEGIEEGMKKLNDGKMRYRGVIVAPQ